MKGPFEERSIYEYFKQEIYPIIYKQELEKLKLLKQNQLDENEKKQRFNLGQPSMIQLPKTQKPGCEFPFDPNEDLLIKAMKNTDV